MASTHRVSDDDERHEEFGRRVQDSSHQRVQKADDVAIGQATWVASAGPMKALLEPVLK